jgi:hypothetical protein
MHARTCHMHINFNRVYLPDIREHGLIEMKATKACVRAQCTKNSEHGILPINATATDGADRDPHS